MLFSSSGAQNNKMQFPRGIKSKIMTHKLLYALSSWPFMKKKIWRCRNIFANCWVFISVYFKTRKMLQVIGSSIGMESFFLLKTAETEIAWICFHYNYNMLQNILFRIWLFMQICNFLHYVLPIRYLTKLYLTINILNIIHTLCTVHIRYFCIKGTYMFYATTL